MVRAMDVGSEVITTRVFPVLRFKYVLPAVLSVYGFVPPGSVLSVGGPVWPKGLSGLSGSGLAVRFAGL